MSPAGNKRVEFRLGALRGTDFSVGRLFDDWKPAAHPVEVGFLPGDEGNYLVDCAWRQWSLRDNPELRHHGQANFNFDPARSHENYPILAPQKGAFNRVFDSDAIDFTGRRRLEQSESQAVIDSQLHTHLPTRTDLVVVRTLEVVL